MLYIAAAKKTARPAPPDAVTSAPGASDDPMPGPHFAGLLTDRREHAERAGSARLNTL